MILKKPYGLLIKHFKLIHLIMTLLCIYVLTKTSVIVTFFSDYVANNYSVTVIENMVSTYISPFLYVAIAVMLVMLIAVFILLKYKKKPNKMYIITIGYYILLLIFILIAAHLIDSLTFGFWETASARQYRDFSKIIYYPQYIFIFILAVRALGFNIKKFDFKSDIKELELSEEDSELVEINLEFDTTEAERKVRRLIREFSYYFRENKLIFIVMISIVAFVFLYLIVTGYEKTNFKYDQGDSFVYNGFKYTVHDSIITNLSYGGKILSTSNYNLLVKFSATNIGKEDASLDYDNFKVYIGSNYYYPILDISGKFKDYSSPYYGEKIKTGETKTYLFAYVIEKKYKNNDFKLTLYNGFSLKDENYTPKTINVNLNPLVIDNVTLVSSVNLNQQISFAGTYLNNSNLSIKDFYVGKKYNYTYEACHFNECASYNDFVLADYSLQNKRTLLVLDYDFMLDDTTAYYESIKSFSGFASDFVKVRYEYNGNIKTSAVKNITPTNMKGKIVLEVNSEVETAKSIDLLITIRNKSYLIKLK